MHRHMFFNAFNNLPSNDDDIRRIMIRLSSLIDHYEKINTAIKLLQDPQHSLSFRRDVIMTINNTIVKEEDKNVNFHLTLLFSFCNAIECSMMSIII